MQVSCIDFMITLNCSLGGNSKNVNTHPKIPKINPIWIDAIKFELGSKLNCDEHFLKLVLNCCVTGPELLRAMLIYISAQQFRTRNAAIQDQL